MGRAPCTKETLPDFHEWCRVTRHPLLFRRLTGCQRTPGIGVSQNATWTTQSTPLIGCHGQSHHLYMTSIYHFIHINISYKNISTFTCNMSFYVQAMTHTIKPCNGHCTYQFITCQYTGVRILTSKQVTTLSSSDTLTIKPCRDHSHI